MPVKPFSTQPDITLDPMASVLPFPLVLLTVSEPKPFQDIKLSYEKHLEEKGLVGRGSSDLSDLLEDRAIFLSSFATPGDKPKQPLTKMALLEAAISYAAVPIFILDGNRKHIDGNQKACQTLGVEKTELVGLTLDDITDPSFLSQCASSFTRLLKEGEAELENRIKTPSGKILDVALSAKANILPGVHLHTWTSVKEVQDTIIPEDKRLSERERDIMKLIAAGENHQTIAKKLYLSPETVRAYSRSARLKLGAKSREHAVVLAAATGQIDIDNIK